VNSGVRALIVSIALFLLWGTMVTVPFRTFAHAAMNFYGRVLRYSHMPPVALGFVLALLLAATLVALLILGATDFSRYIAGISASLTMLYYLYTCIRDTHFDFLAFPIAVGLALALLFLIFQAEYAGMWLADAYVYSILMLLFIELVLTPISIANKVPAGKLTPLFSVPTDSLATKISDFLQIPMFVWGGFLFALVLVPVVYFSRGRKTE
jgi:hypothetical protein